MPELDPVIVLSARYGLALLFLSAAVGKFRGLTYFRGNLREYALLPDPFVPIAAVLIPLVELTIAAAAVNAATGARAMIAGGALLGVYAFAIGINLLRGRSDIDCGCTGPAARQTLNGWLVLRNIALIAVAACGAAAPATRPLGALDFAVLLLALAGGSILYAAVNQLTANAPRLDAMDAYMEQP